MQRFEFLPELKALYDRPVLSKKQRKAAKDSGERMAKRAKKEGMTPEGAFADWMF